MIVEKKNEVSIEKKFHEAVLTKYTVVIVKYYIYYGLYELLYLSKQI